LGDSCLEIAGSSGIRSCAPMFFSGRLVSEGALQSVTSQVSTIIKSREGFQLLKFCNKQKLFKCI
jgi:hypothetical protein